MVILDGAIVLVALPSIGADLGFSEHGLQWVLSAYALTFGGLLLLGDGRPTCSGAAACSWSESRPSRSPRSSAARLVARRPDRGPGGSQGIGAAIMTPSALSIISTTFPEGAERNKALGI